MQEGLVDKENSFSSFGLDNRLLKGVEKMRFEHPTLVQTHAVPLALKGHDILARARTGSGKTVAYLLPVLQKILNGKLSEAEPHLRCLVLVPTVELCKQVLEVSLQLAAYCSKEVRCVHVSSDSDVKTQK